MNKSNHNSLGLNKIKQKQIINVYKPELYQIIGFGFLGLLLLTISLLLFIIGFNIVLDPDINANLIKITLTIGLGFILLLISVKFFVEPLSSRIFIMKDEIRIKRFFRIATVPFKHVSTITIVYSIPLIRKHKDAKLKRLILRSKAMTIVAITMDAYSNSQRYEIKENLIQKIRKVSKVTVNKEYVKEFSPIYF